MVPAFLQKRQKRSFTLRFLLSVIVCLVLTGLSLTAMVLIITSRSLAKEHKLSLLTLLMVVMLPGWALIERMKA